MSDAKTTARARGDGPRPGFRMQRLLAAPLGILILAGSSGAAAAETSAATPPVHVASGESVLIASTGNRIEITEPPEKGRAWAVPPVEGKPSALFYVAPSEPESFTETLGYLDGATAARVDLVVGPAPPLPGSDTYEASFRILFALFVLAILMESGLAVLFNWRVYQTFFATGVKTPVTVAFAILLVAVFRLDLATTLVNLYAGAHYAPGPAGALLTALILAGGSSGVNKILVALGFRQERPPEEQKPKPQRTEGWISVRYTGAHTGPVTVLLGDPAKLAAVGEISSNRARGRLGHLLLRDGSRFPPGGGHSFPAGAECQIELRDRTGKHVPGAVWGPYPVAPGAIIDVEFS